MASTQLSGGSPPSFFPRSMPPRVRSKRMPSSRAAPISAAMMSPPPRGKTYEWSLAVVHPDFSRAAIEPWAAGRTVLSSIVAQIPYRPLSQSNRLWSVNRPRVIHW